MRKYIFSGAALVLGVLASPGYSATIVLAFDGNANGNVNGIPCTSGSAPFCITISGKGAALSPPGTNPEFATTLVSFGNIIFNELTISGDPNAAFNGTFAFTPSGADFSDSSTTLTDSGMIASGALSGTSVMITDTLPTVFASVDAAFTEAPVYFSGGTVNVPAALVMALGLTGPYTATLVSDPGCNYPEGARDPQPPGSFAGACAAGFGNGGTTFGAESQYLEVAITSVATPEPTSSLLLGFGLVAVGSLARRKRQGN